MDFTQNHSYSTLKQMYSDFAAPSLEVYFKGKDFTKNKVDFLVTDVVVDLSSGFEASVAEITIGNVFDQATGEFLAKDFASVAEIGVLVELKMGYFKTLSTVFQGVVVGISYRSQKGVLPEIVVTAMDVKGVMMANSYAQQISAKSYGEAVGELLRKPVYSKLYGRLSVDNTPDKGQKTPENTMEMVAESDYEFVVRVAQKFNFEFFVKGDEVVFRPAKKVTSNLITLSEDGMVSFDIGYSVTGLVSEVEVRAMDTRQGKLVSYKATRTGDLSLGSKAAALLKKSKKVYVDQTAQSTKLAQARVNSLMEEMSYRFGNFQCTMVGIPEVVPGRFIALESLGKGVDNQFYLTKVTHRFSQDGYQMDLEGCAAKLK